MVKGHPVLRPSVVTVQLVDHDKVGMDARRIRKQVDVSLAELSSKMQISQSMLSRLEMGERSWTEPMIDRFNKAVKGILDARSKVPDA